MKPKLGDRVKFIGQNARLETYKEYTIQNTHRDGKYITLKEAKGVYYSKDFEMTKGNSIYKNIKIAKHKSTTHDYIEEIIMNVGMDKFKEYLKNSKFVGLRIFDEEKYKEKIKNIAKIAFKQGYECLHQVLGDIDPSFINEKFVEMWGGL